ncbi:hypothetical protein [Aequorivita antarctica]|uniref:Uncharacterized protein n=1 Tax=Aequorivita antarctica TaxID=153266 RepID=A0A5C6YYD9_9FLAO|nr:hypothetical protein [Aequorivita antarctica]TXD72071.1 hypothetical protein ESU54_13510 [Aequorivita antarctica]SRX75655.1 hypothetical protein AEQU3_02651 [Aequorivita antarctica]
MTDKEYLNRISKIEIYCEIIRGILRHAPSKKLKFPSDDEYLRFVSFIDLIEDTQYAITDFYDNGLITNSETQGQMYLRLYGVLNAIYMQMQAVIDLIEILKIHHKKRISTDLRELKIIEVRNKIGAHTSNYLIEKLNGKPNTESYRVAQSRISKWGDRLMIVSNRGISEEFHLMNLIKEFTNLIELNLDSICETKIKSFFIQDSEKKDWLMFRLNHTRGKETT